MKTTLIKNGQIITATEYTREIFLSRTERSIWWEWISERRPMRWFDAKGKSYLPGRGRPVHPLQLFLWRIYLCRMGDLMLLRGKRNHHGCRLCQSEIGKTLKESVDAYEMKRLHPMPAANTVFTMRSSTPAMHCLKKLNECLSLGYSHFGILHGI